MCSAHLYVRLWGSSDVAGQDCSQNVSIRAGRGLSGQRGRARSGSFRRLACPLGGHVAAEALGLIAQPACLGLVCSTRPGVLASTRLGTSAGAVTDDTAGEFQFHQHDIESACVEAYGTHEGVDNHWGRAERPPARGRGRVLAAGGRRRWWRLPRPYGMLLSEGDVG